jgi:hypothetical protein
MTRRLDVAATQAGRRADVRRRHRVLDEPVQQPLGGSRAAERLAEGRGELVEDGDGRRLGALLKSSDASPSTSAAASSAGPDARAASSSAATMSRTSSTVAALRVTAPAATPWPPSTAEMTVTSEPA